MADAIGADGRCAKCRYQMSLGESPEALPFACRVLGAVTKLTIQIALDGFLRSRKKTQPYRGTARLSDEEIGKPDKQDV